MENQEGLLCKISIYFKEVGGMKLTKEVIEKDKKKIYKAVDKLMNDVSKAFTQYFKNKKIDTEIYFVVGE